MDTQSKMVLLSGQNVFFVDLHHPGGEDEEVNRLLEEIPDNTVRIFLLGDIFHYWINEKQFIRDTYTPFLSRLQALARRGIQLFFLEGNRDFLASHYLDDQPWIDVLCNPFVIEIGGRAVYLGHGDELCWNDWAYQMYKSVIRSQPMRFLADHLPASWQRRTVRKMSETSTVLVSRKDRDSLKVPEKAYEQVARSGVDVIVHGHLHDSYQRALVVDGRRCEIFCFGWKDDKRNLIYFES